MIAAHAAPRCGAKTRTGKACGAPAVREKTRCRKHGGGRNKAGCGSGAPVGNQNALKHGNYSAAVLSELRYLKEIAEKLRIKN